VHGVIPLRLVAVARGLEQRWRDFWLTPDPVLVDAGAAGELLVARVRLVLTALVLLIPALQVLPWPPDREVLVGLAGAGTGFAAAVLAYGYGRRRLYRPWLGFATSVLDVSLVSATLVTFLALGQPHTAVNSKVVYEIYLVAIAATTLRFDPRVCVVATGLAILEYLGVVVYASRHWALNDPSFAPFPYGMFSASTQVSRLILLGVAGAVSTTVVLRSRRLQWLSARDRLTGLVNRGVFDDLLLDEASRALRSGRPLSMLMLDVDHFKAYNDTHGHQAGDTALRVVGATIRQVVREREIVARYGGDEFVVLLPETRVDVAIGRAEAIRRAVEESRLRTPTDAAAQVTVSIGVAALPLDGLDGRNVLERADARMYEVKQIGRNAVLGPPTALSVGSPP
jgi:two-component system cell cycle response regulator